MDEKAAEFLSLFKVDLEEGTIHLFGERMVVFNTEALGLFRREIIDTLGQEKSRHVFTRMGYLFGQHDYQMLKQILPQADPVSLAGVARRLVSIQGMAGMRDVVTSGLFTSQSARQFVIEWGNSIEATLQLKLSGTSAQRSCSMIMGYASGYASALLGRKVLFIETDCIGQGKERCRAVGRLDEDWGDEANLMRSHLQPINVESMLRRLAERVEEQQETLEKTEAEIRRLRLSAQVPSEFSDMIGDSHAMKQVLSIGWRSARFDTTILIQGETGTGKEMLARAVHRASRRRDGPFVAINCGALTETILESELFGYRRGAFTGADKDYEGIFRAADGGTILLDEISEISPALQVKLLRVLQEKEVRPVGSSQVVPVDVRVIAATNRDLRNMVLRGRFRDDLFYRLNVISVHLPPLRERESDVVLLADHFLRVFTEKHGRSVQGFSPEARRVLLSAPLPGNVRQLQNAIERAVILGDGPQIDAEHLLGDLSTAQEEQATAGTPAVGRAAGRTLDDPEARGILALLARNGGSRTRTAAALGVARSTLWRRMKRLGLG